MTDTPDDIQRKIANLEALRSTLGDAAVDAAIAALRAQADPTEIIDGTAGVGGNNSGQNIGVNRGIVQLLIGSTVLSKDSIKPVEQGLAALGELVSNPAIRTTVAIYSAQFEQVATQILRMQAYKEIHDLLHQMHFHCYIVLNSSSPVR
jgi:hypothetical protein